MKAEAVQVDLKGVVGADLDGSGLDDGVGWDGELRSILSTGEIADIYDAGSSGKYKG